jgi:hypothetical protein
MTGKDDPQGDAEDRPTRAPPSYSAESAATRWREQHPDADVEAAGGVGGPSAEARDHPPPVPRRSASAESAATRRSETDAPDDGPPPSG